MSQSVVYESVIGIIVVMDSIAYINEQNEGDIIVCGSHGGKSAAEHAARFKPKGVIFNDAGRGKNDAGIGGLEILNREGIMAAAVDTMSSRIGEGLDSYNSGVISAANEKAKQVGIETGISAKEAALKMLGETKR